MSTFHTVGHSTHGFAAFLALLRSHGIEHLVDVRRHPGSRRHPHFNRGELEERLGEGGAVTYPARQTALFREEDGP